MRTRFKPNRIASSSNYRRSRELHTEYIKEFHNKHIEEIRVISAEIIVKQQKYIRVFGKLIPVSEEELRIHNTFIL